MIYEVVYCSDCKKPVKSVPSWLASVNVRFTCESCRQKHPRGVVGFDAPPGVRVGGDLDGDGEEVSDAPGELVDEETSLDEVEADDAPHGEPVEE